MADLKPIIVADGAGRTFLVGTNQEDADLAARIVTGDRQALADVFNRFGGAVKSLAVRVLRDEALAEDVVQETFVDLWRAPEKYDPARGSLRTFVLTIAHRRAVDVVRSEQARTKRQDRQLPDPYVYDVEEEVLTSRVGSQVREAVSRLGDDERKAISLAYFGGLTYVEVARALDAPEGTVKSRIRSGMTKLAQTLEGVM